MIQEGGLRAPERKSLEIESDKLSSDISSDRVIRNPDRAKIKLLD